jgi:hypothetical protein
VPGYPVANAKRASRAAKATASLPLNKHFEFEGNTMNT